MKTMDLDDDVCRALLTRMAQRDEDALAAFYDATVNRVYALALRISGQRAAAEEVVSDVYMQIWEQAHRYDATRGRVLAWVLTICRSRALDLLRRRDDAVLHPDPDELRADAVCHQSNPLSLLLTLESHSIVHEAIKELNPTQQHLLSLAFFRDLSHQEIATQTGMPLGSVKTVLRKAMATMKDMLHIHQAMYTAEDRP